MNILFDFDLLKRQTDIAESMIEKARFIASLSDADLYAKSIRFTPRDHITVEEAEAMQADIVALYCDYRMIGKSL